MAPWHSWDRRWHSGMAVLACPCSPSEVSLHKSVYIKEYGSGRLCDYNSGRNCHHSDYRGKMWWERSEAVELSLEKAYTGVGSGLPRDGNRAEILRPVNGAEALRDLACVPPQWGVPIPGFKFLNFGYLKLLLSCAHWDFQSLLNVERVPGIKTLSVKKVGVVTSCIALPGRSCWTSASEDVSPVVCISFIHFLELFDHGIP